MTKNILFGLIALAYSVSAWAGSPPVLQRVIYSGANTREVIFVTNAPPADSAVAQDYIQFCGTNLWVEGQTKIWIGSTLLTGFSYNGDRGCIDGRMPATPLSGKIKITTPYGTTVSSQVIKTIVDPRASKCKLATTLSAKWGNAARTSLLTTLTFKNTGPVNCWLFKSEANGQWLPGGPIDIGTDGACIIQYGMNGGFVDKKDPQLPKIVLAPGKSVSSTFDLFKIEGYQRIDCDKKPTPTKLKMIYMTGIHEVSVRSPVFEMPW